MSSERKKLVKELDRAFGSFIKARDGYKSVTSGKTERITCSHLFSRTSYSTRWDEDNAFAQTASENYTHEFDPYPLTRWFIKKFGLEKYDELHRKNRTTLKLKDWELKELIEKYKNKLKELQNKNV